MTFEIKVPVLPESVADATVAKWHVKMGGVVQRDGLLVDLETDKVMLEVPGPTNGVLTKILVPEGETVTAGTVLGIVTETKAAPLKKEPAKPVAEPEKRGGDSTGSSPAVRRMMAEHNLDIHPIKASGKGGRLTKEDVEKHLQAQSEIPKAAATSAAELLGERSEKRVPMSRLRARIAERLLQVQQEAAILTSFTEVNMQPVMEMRQNNKDRFEKVHGIRLGFMSFFVKAAVEALKRFPMVNASVDGSDIIYHNFYDIGIAVGGGPRGLVVPIVRNADMLTMADIEKAIREYADKVQNNKLTIEEMMGGTFTITNGGVYGSMLSTPIINPPQSAILGMHKITERPVVEKGQIVIRPMMYLALSYDHRIIDGSDAVQFLVVIKELLEDPARLLLQI